MIPKNKYLGWFIVPVILINLLTGCKKDVTSAGLTNYADTVKGVNEQVYSTMKQYYLWYDSIPSVNPDNYQDPQTFINTLKNWRDRWSFILTQGQYQSEFVTGIYYGYGFSYGFDQDNNMRIAYVFKASDFYTDGITRGWIIKNVNGMIPDSSNAGTIFGSNIAGEQNSFTLTRPDGLDTTIIFAKKNVTRNTVLVYDTIQINHEVVGYISFLEFELDADSALMAAISYFMQNNVSDLVLDLRYNGGGLIQIAQHLADMLAGSVANKDVFANLTFNNKNTKSDETINFANSSVALNLHRLFVITTKGTASASELVINGLRPYMPVYLIGSTTDGKPVGMIQFSLSYNYYFYPVTFQLTNAQNYGGYFNGLTVDQPSIDDLTHNFGDRNEACLSQALHYIETGSFAATGNTSAKTFKIYHEWQPLKQMIKKLE